VAWAPATDAGPEQPFIPIRAHTESPKVHASGQVEEWPLFKTCIVIDVKSQAVFGLKYIYVVNTCNAFPTAGFPG